MLTKQFASINEELNKLADGIYTRIDEVDKLAGETQNELDELVERVRRIEKKQREWQASIESEIVRFRALLASAEKHLGELN